MRKALIRCPRCRHHVTELATEETAPRKTEGKSINDKTVTRKAWCRACDVEMSLGRIERHYQDCEDTSSSDGLGLAEEEDERRREIYDRWRGSQAAVNIEVQGRDA